jgi:hypothetical protein
VALGTGLGGRRGRPRGGVRRGRRAAASGGVIAAAPALAIEASSRPRSGPDRTRFTTGTEARSVGSGWRSGPGVRPPLRESRRCPVAAGGPGGGAAGNGPGNPTELASRPAVGRDLSGRAPAGGRVDAAPAPRARRAAASGGWSGREAAPRDAVEIRSKCRISRPTERLRRAAEGARKPPSTGRSREDRAARSRPAPRPRGGARPHHNRGSLPGRAQALTTSRLQAAPSSSRGSPSSSTSSRASMGFGGASRVPAACSSRSQGRPRPCSGWRPATTHGAGRGALHRPPRRDRRVPPRPVPWWITYTPNGATKTCSSTPSSPHRTSISHRISRCSPMSVGGASRGIGTVKRRSP